MKRMFGRNLKQIFILLCSFHTMMLQTCDKVDMYEIIIQHISLKLRNIIINIVINLITLIMLKMLLISLI